MRYVRERHSEQTRYAREKYGEYARHELNHTSCFVNFSFRSLELIGEIFVPHVHRLEIKVSLKI
jgi:hypothetical protein